MDRYAVAGNPVEHSQSPFIHAAFARQTGQAIDYGRLLCPLDGFAARGARASRRRRPAGARLQRHRAVQVRGASRWRPAHTPRAALRRRGQHAALRRRRLAGRQHRRRRPGARHRAQRRRAAGRAARAADRCRRRRGRRARARCSRPRRPRWWSPTARRPRRRRWSSGIAALAARHGVELRPRRSDDCGDGFDVVVNATATQPAGRRACRSPPRVLAPGALALDMMYGPAAQPLPRLGRSARRARRATAWACWSSRPPRPSRSGAACARTRRRCWPRCASGWPPPRDDALGLRALAAPGWRCCCCRRSALQLYFLRRASR